MIYCGKEAVKEICCTKLLQLILLQGGTSLTCTARAADQKHMINKRKTHKQIPISSFTSLNPHLTSGIAPCSEWLNPKFSSQNEKKWSYMILLFRYQQQKSWYQVPASSSATDLLCELQEITLPASAEPASSVKKRHGYFFSLEISLLIQLTTWALTTVQRREWDPSFWGGTGLAQLRAIVKLHPQGLGRRLDTFYYISFWPIWECTKTGPSFFHNLYLCLD